MPTDLVAAGTPQTPARAVGCVAFAHPPQIRPAYGPSKWSPSPSSQPVQHTGPLPACPVLLFPLPPVSLRNPTVMTRQGRKEPYSMRDTGESSAGISPMVFFFVNRAHVNQADPEIIPFLNPEAQSFRSLDHNLSAHTHTHTHTREECQLKTKQIPGKAKTHRRTPKAQLAVQPQFHPNSK